MLTSFAGSRFLLPSWLGTQFPPFFPHVPFAYQEDGSRLSKTGTARTKEGVPESSGHWMTGRRREVMLLQGNGRFSLLLLFAACQRGLLHYRRFQLEEVARNLENRVSWPFNPLQLFSILVRFVCLLRVVLCALLWLLSNFKGSFSHESTRTMEFMMNKIIKLPTTSLLLSPFANSTDHAKGEHN